MTTGEDTRRGATHGDLATEASPVEGIARSRAFPPVHDHVDTDEIPVVGAAGAAAAGTPASTSTASDHRFGEDDAVDPVVEEPDAAVSPDAAGPHHGAAHVHRPRPGLLMAIIASLTVVLLAAASLIAYLWRVADAWEVRAQELTEANYALGSALADERDALAATEAQLDLVTQQLNASKDTVSRLQAENAQWGDDAAYAQEQISGLQGLISEATAVSGSLSRCIEGHDKLVDYLTAPEDRRPKPRELRTFRESVDELCTVANEGYLQLQQSVAP